MALSISLQIAEIDREEVTLIVPRHIAIDFSHYDRLSLNQGQYRYGINLIGELSRLETDDEFIVLGSQSSPPKEIKEIFSKENWTYQIPFSANRKLPHYLDHIRYAFFLWKSSTASQTCD